MNFGEQSSINAPPHSQETSGGSGNVIASHVTINQGGANTVKAGQVVIRQGGAVGVKTESLTMTMGGIVGAQTESASLTASGALTMIAAGNVSMDQSAAGVLVTGSDVTMDQSAAGAVVAREVKADRCSTVFLVAGKVSGNVRSLFGPRESLVFGAVTGAIAGITMLALAIAGRAGKEDQSP